MHMGSTITQGYGPNGACSPVRYGLMYSEVGIQSTLTPREARNYNTYKEVTL